MFAPARLIIDGTEHKMVSHHEPRGNERYYEIRIAKRGIVILLPLRLFFLVGSLAMLRDVKRETSSETDQQRGFVHRNQLKLSKNIMNQYVYQTKGEIREQLQQAHSSQEISSAERDLLIKWPVIESGANSGLPSHWRCAIAPEAITVNPRVLGFPNADFQHIGTEYFRRHPVFLPDRVRRG